MKEKQRVLVTGFGIVSPIGNGAGENLAGLRAGRDGVSTVTAFDVSKTRCKTAGQVNDDWLKDVFPANRRTQRLHRSSRMVASALVEAMSMAGTTSPELVVFSTSVGAMSNGEQFYRAVLKSKSRRSMARWVGNYMPQKPILDALELVGLRLPMQVVSNACSSGTNSIGHAFNLIRDGLNSCVICGGYDPLSELVFVGFDSLQASTPEKIRPFDLHRSGLVLGEGSAVLILESEESVHKRKATAYAEISGYGVSTDTYHLTQPNPSGVGPRLSMERALQSAGSDSIDYINAHGTATLYNDATEGIAISQLLPGAPVSSTKSMMGHALGAAGAIEAVFCVLALQEQFLPPNIHFREPDPTWRFEVVANQSRSASIRTALSNSFGFGGTNASLLLRGI
ncbi:MAG: beta-ketoacyl-[acyl-carrier-protein] synthase family protein [Chthoniobacterales bacterium]